MPTGRDLITFRKTLLAWFREYQRDLPWRRSKVPYRIWVSEIMLQQTRVAAVIPYYERFLERFPDIKSLAEAPQADVLQLWSGLGYYSRARNLQLAAKQIVSKHHGNFPADETDALALAGIGKYSAAAILSIAYGKTFAVLDGNVARVLARLGAVRGELREAKRWRKLQDSATELLDAKSAGDWNQAMMELGATICTPRAPQCSLCPVAKYCKARKLGLTDVVPEKRRKRESVKIVLAAAVLLDARGRALLLPPPVSRRKRGAQHDIAALVSRMWHFPTVQVHKNPAQELRHFLAELFPRGKTNTQQLESLAHARHTVTYRHITLLPFRLRAETLPQIAAAKIIPLSDVCSLAVSNLTRKVARSALNAPAAAATVC